MRLRSLLKKKWFWIAFMALIGFLFVGAGTNLFQQKDGKMPPAIVNNVNINQPINNIVENQSQPKSIGHEFRLDDPVLIKKKCMKLNGYEFCLEPPNIQITSQSTFPSDKNNFKIRCGRLKDYDQETLPCLSYNGRLILNDAGAGHDVTAEYDGDQIIKAVSSNICPFGSYKARIIFSDHEKATSGSKDVVFNYAYYETFDQISETVIPNNSDSICRDSRGLKVKNKSIKGHVSCDIKQKFDFSSFVISGMFTVKSQDTSSPCAIDFVLCDEWSEKLAIILGDGSPSTYSIKYGKDKYSIGEVTRADVKNAIQETTTEYPLPNYFLIEILQKADGCVCSVYINTENQSFTSSNLVHNRTLSNIQLCPKSLYLKIRLWKAGTMTLYNLLIGEVVPDRFNEN